LKTFLHLLTSKGSDMGTLDIVRELLFHIQGESNPIYLAERRETALWPRFDLERWRSCLFLGLLLVVPILTFVERQFGVRFTAYRDIFIQSVLILTGGLLSVGWTVPLATLAGQGISRERTAQTWGMLLVTPFPTEVILMAKAAAGVGRVWKLVVSLTFLASLPGLFVAGPLMAAQAAWTGDTPLLAVLFMGAGMVAIIVEREQEIALSIVVGLVAAFASESRRMAWLLGATGGLLIRLAQALITVSLAFVLAPLASPNFALLNAIAGSATLLAIAPGFTSLFLIIALIVLREGLIRALFAWLLRRAREG
jgi:hypothetical protein